MALDELTELEQRRKQQCVKLIEAIDITKQLLESVERRDQVSVQMLVAMRQEPIAALAEMEESLRARLHDFPPETAIRLRELMSGAEPEDGERAAGEQAARFIKLHGTLTELDRRVSLMLGGRSSFYNTFRETPETK